MDIPGHKLLVQLSFWCLIWINAHTLAQSVHGCPDGYPGSADDYFNAWDTVGMYPYGVEFCDIEDQGSSIVREIPFMTPFYGDQYDLVNIFADGFISFGPRALAEFLPRQTWPNTAYSPGTNEVDPPMIAIYYNDAETPDTSGAEAALYYRVVDPSQHTGVLAEINSRLLDLLYNDVVAALPSETFYPTRAFITTWYRMIFKDYRCVTAQCPSNTYQVVVLTDGTLTYSILNYNDVNWIGGADDEINCNECDQCDPVTGTNVGHPNCFLAQMGFNRGSGLEFTPLPLSSNADQVNIDVNSGVPSVNGRYIYEVSGTTIVRGGCAIGNLISESENWPTIVSPSSGVVLGGFEVSVAGVCLDPTATITCVFGSSEVPAVVVDEYRTICEAPLLTETGSVPVTMSVNGVTQGNAGAIYVDPTQPYEADALLVNSYDWYRPDVETLQLTWDPALLNSGSAASVIVGVNLYGYRESTTDGVTNSEWNLLTTLAGNVSNSGSWSFSPADHRCDLTDCDWYMGALKLTATNGSEAASIWTEVVPLGWFVTAALTSQYGSNWPSAMCSRWASEGQVTVVGPTPCPCSPGQAAADIGRFRPEAPCGNGELTCTMGLSNCYTSVQTGDSGSASRCCYDTEGVLIYAGDAINASYASSVSIDGAAPFGPGRVPLLSHWLSDVLPYYWCCAWTESLETCKNNYAIRRATPDCDGYQPPAISGTYGDPHVMTLDGHQYTFNGEGEFWMVRTTLVEPSIENINIQARMEPTAVGSNMASVLTAMAIQEGTTPESNTTRVQVQLSASDATNALTVFVDGTTVDFADPLSSSKEFYNYAGGRKTVLTTPDPTAVASVQVKMESGVGISVIAINQTLSIAVTVPEQYNGLTSGLMGIRNGLTIDDFTNRDGVAISINSSNENTHNEFGLSWMIEEAESRFTYIGAMNYDYFNNIDFAPTFEPNITTSSVTEDQVLAVCGSLTSACAFDYVVTGDQYFAADTLNQEDILLSTRTSALPVTVCSRLEAANSFKTVVGGYRVGSVVTFTGCEEGYDASGTERYECLGDGQWNANFDFQCSDDDELVLILAIVIPTVVILLIVIVIVLVYFQRKHKKNEKPPKQQPVPAVSGHHVSMTQPNNNLYHTSGMIDLSRSSSTVNNESGIHTLSRNSIVLTQELRTARPPRPGSQTHSRVHSNSLSSNNSYSVADRVSINSSRHSHYSNVMPAFHNDAYDQVDNDDVIDTRIQVPNLQNRPPQPLSDQPPPIVRPKEYYDNLASVDSSGSDSDHRHPPTQPPPPDPRPTSMRNPYAPGPAPYQPRPYSYAAARPYTYTSEYAKPMKGNDGGVSGSFV